MSTHNICFCGEILIQLLLFEKKKKKKLNWAIIIFFVNILLFITFLSYTV